MSLFFMPSNSSFHRVGKKNISDLPISFLWALNPFSSGTSTSSVTEDFYLLLFWGEVNDFPSQCRSGPAENQISLFSPKTQNPKGFRRSSFLIYFLSSQKKRGFVSIKMTPLSTPRHATLFGVTTSCPGSWRGSRSPAPER